MDEYYYKVVASVIDERGVMRCWLISNSGKTNVLPFLELEFEGQS
jgi:hypothetical protein